MKVCCEGGPMTAGCHHDHCTGPRETKMVEITEKEFELFERLKKIWFHSSERSGSFFICGEAGEHDKLGLPDTILVCPTMGVNITAVYRKENVMRSGQ